MSSAEYKEYIDEHLSDHMLMVMMVEEAAELIQACCKCLRTGDPEGLTPVTEDEAREMFEEEAGDLLMLLELAGVVEDGTTDENPKWERWYKRMTGTLQ